MAPKKTVTITELREYSNTTSRNLEDHKQLVVTVTVLIKSCVRTWYNGQAAFFMELRDSSEDIAAICVTSPDTINKLFHQLKTSKVYTITGFTLINTDLDNTSILHPKYIYLGGFTVVELYQGYPAPPEQWLITALKDIKKGKLVNVIGACVYIGDVIYRKNRKLRKVMLQDETHTVILKLWEEETLIFDNLPLGTMIFVKDGKCVRECSELNTTRFVRAL